MITDELDEGRIERSSHDTKGEGRLYEDSDAIAAASDHYRYIILPFLRLFELLELEPVSLLIL